MNIEEEVKEAIKVILQKMAVEAGATVKDIMEKLYRSIKNISTDDIKNAWNLEELKMDELSLEKCISFVKKEFNSKLYSSACVLKKNDAESKYKLEVHICFLDKNNSPILNGDAKHWIVHTNVLNKDLLDQFGDKDMIILK